MLAQLHVAAKTGDSTGSRSVGLQSRLGVGRGALRQTIEFTIAHGWVARNAGHGHPLRHEFVLTDRGRPVAASCDRLFRTVVLLDALEPFARKWTAPLLRVLGTGGVRFGELRSALASHGLTDRALSLALRELRGLGWVERRVVPGYPPGVEYVATAKVRPLVEAVARL